MAARCCCAQADGLLDLDAAAGGLFRGPQEPEAGRASGAAAGRPAAVSAFCWVTRDVNDHDQLRADSVLALAVGRSDLTGEERGPRPRQSAGRAP